MADRKILIIDLKSFYASCECAMRGLDPFRVNLVVADKERGNGTICLAVSPALKALGVPNRCRLFEIPKDIKYIAAKPRMKKYIEYSANIYAIYLKYFSKEDIYVYSIDEAFIDVTDYLKLYKTDELSLAKKLIKEIRDELSLIATCGIGPNLFLAKVALDIISKKSSDNIGIITHEIYDNEIIYHEPLTDFWSIGHGTAKRLAKYKVFNMYQLRLLEDDILKREFGVKGAILKEHAFGVEETTIKEIKAYKPKGKSITEGQVLFQDYTFEEGIVVVKEMALQLIMQLLDKKLCCKTIGISMRYSKDELFHGSGESYTFLTHTNSPEEITNKFVELYEESFIRGQYLRGLNLGLSGLIKEENKDFTLFNLDKDQKDYDMAKAMLEIRKKYGQTSVIKASSLDEKATALIRAKLIGGHNSE